MDVGVGMVFGCGSCDYQRVDLTLVAASILDTGNSNERKKHTRRKIPQSILECLVVDEENGRMIEW